MQNTSRSKHNKVYIRTGFILIVVGIIGLAFPFLSLGFLSDLTFLNTLAETKSVSLPGPHGPDETASPTVSTPTPDYNRSGIKDRLVISSAGINMPVIQSDSANVLLKGGWLFPSTSTPDASGNTVIFGHRFRYLPPISNTFYHLDKTKVGDSFTITWKGKTYNYRVSEVKIIEPTDLSVIQATSDSRVTLITCAPLFSTKQRLVVVGEPVTK